MEEKELEKREGSLVERLKARSLNLQKRELEEAVVVMVDVSASMLDSCGTQSKIESVKQSIPYLNSPQNYISYGLVAFSGTAFCIQTQTTSFQNLICHSDLLIPSGQTNIPAALKLGLEMVGEINVEKKRFVLLTDGQNNVGREVLDEMISRCVEARVVVDTIAFGRDADEALLRNLSQRTAGKFQKVESPLQLEQAYQKLNFKVRYLT